MAVTSAVPSPAPATPPVVRPLGTSAMPGTHTAAVMAAVLTSKC